MTEKSRICSASSSLVRRALLGLNPSAFSVSVSFPCRCRRLLLPAKSGSAAGFSGFDRSVTVALGLAFCFVRVRK
ncbi:hypothetical protein SLE2022_266590 [Rubroshorea leprosula]